MRKHKILIISPFFAPFSGVGANRMVSLSSFLSNLGHEVSVLRNIQKSLKNLYTAKEPTGIEYFDIKLEDYLPFDDMVALYKRKIEEILEEKTFDCIIITVGPYYTLRIVETIKQKTSAPVIIDFRDLYTYEVLRHETLRSDLSRIVRRKSREKTERPAVSAADAIITVTADDAQRMRRYYPDKADRVLEINNGYDEDRLSDFAAADKKETLPGEKTYYDIGFFGKISRYSTKYTKELLKAVKNVQEKGYNIRLIHMGEEDTYVEKLIKALAIGEDTYHYLGSKEYSEGMRILSGVDFLGMVYCSPSGYGTKVFDYVFLNKPILLMGRRGTELGRLVGTFKNGFSCSNAKQYEQALIRLVESRQSELDFGLDVKEYSRKAQNQKFLNLINELSNSEN